MKRFLTFSLLLLSSFGFRASGFSAQPNILVILADDLGYGDLGCYGAAKIATPNIDRLAAEGMRFTQAVTPSSVCSPTRYGLLTGRYCWRNPLHAPNGVHGAAGPLLFEEQRLTLGKMLQAQGYATAAIGKWHLGYGRGTGARTKFDWTSAKLRPGPLESGFDHFFGMAANVTNPPRFFIEDDDFAGRSAGDKITVTPRPRLPDDVQPWSPTVVWDDARIGGTIAKKAAAALRSQAAAARPFFLYFASNIPHAPHTPAAELAGKSAAGAYGDCVQELDAHVGLLLAALEASGKADNTLVIFTSDNGGIIPQEGDSLARSVHRPAASLRGGKAGIHEGGFRVPFIVRWPDVVKARTTSDQLICLTDVMATLAEALQVPLPATAAEDSVSFLAALAPERSQSPPRASVVLRSMDGVMALREARWKLITQTKLPAIEKKRATVAARENVNQLYDLVNDPAETTNLYNAQPEVVARQRARLAEIEKSGNRKSKP